MTCAHSVRVLIALVAGLAVSGCGGGGGATGAGVDSAAAGSSDAGGEVHTARDVPGDDGVVQVSEGDQGDVGGGLPDGGGVADSGAADAGTMDDADVGVAVDGGADAGSVDGDGGPSEDAGPGGEVTDPPDSGAAPDGALDVAGDLVAAADGDAGVSADAAAGGDAGADSGAGDGSSVSVDVVAGGDAGADGVTGADSGVDVGAGADDGGGPEPPSDATDGGGGADAAVDGGGDAPPALSRVVLTYEELTSGPEQPSPVDDMAGFSMPAGAPLADHVFEGRLELLGEESAGNFITIKDDYNYDLDDERLHLPDFDHAFVQDGHELIPVQRGNINTAHPFWTTILGPGKVWKEDGDNGLSRASLPFAIVQRNSNCTHNGLLTFLFDDTSVSRVHYQITQETCAYFQGDFWGLVDANYIPGAVAGAAQVRAAFAVETANTYPTKPIAELAVDYPGFDLDTLTSGITPIHMTRYGFVYDGVSYVSECVTRSGLYPYCDSMRMPSYSLAKSVFAGTARMLIEQSYGVDVGAQIVDPLVVEASAGPGDWTDVTIDHCLDMTTGHYKFATYMVDEGGAAMSNGFFLAQSLAEKTAGAFDWKRKSAPGSQWVYRSSDTFIAMRAMSEYVQTFAGGGVDIFDLLVQEVWKPLGVGPGAHTSLRTSDSGWQGETFGGYGLWFIADDLAKITDLVNVDGGQIGGAQVLNPASLDAAMQRDPADRGMLTTAATPFMYNNGFWALEFTQAQGYPCDFWVPFMSGYGGITVAMMPSGATYWYVSDNAEYDWQDVIGAAHASVADCCSP